LIIAKAAVAA
jgi:hypothetical protein